MIVYFDSSMLVKLYVDEDQSEGVAALWSQSSEGACSVIGFAEVLSALYRRMRDGTVSAEQFDLVARRFREDWSSLTHVAVSEEVNVFVAHLLATCPLRAMDAIQLASALALREQTGREVRFACADLRLTTAARKEGLGVFPESTP